MSDWVAKEHIPAGDPGRGVWAFTRGQRVPDQMVKDNNWSDYVVAANTREGRQVVAEVTGEPVEEPAKISEKKG